MAGGCLPVCTSTLSDKLRRGMRMGALRGCNLPGKLGGWRLEDNLEAYHLQIRKPFSSVETSNISHPATSWEMIQSGSSTTNYLEDYPSQSVVRA